MLKSRMSSIRRWKISYVWSSTRSTDITRADCRFQRYTLTNQFCNDEFENAIKPAILIPYAFREHVSVAERRNRTVKERMRSLIAGVPYKALPKIMVRGAAKKAKQMINKFPAKNGLSDSVSPEEILEGKSKMDISLRTIAYGQYAQVHDGTDNTDRPRSIHGIAMYQKNEREGYAFMSLETGKLIHSNIWKQLPITPDVIERVESIAQEMIGVEQLIEDIDQELYDIVLTRVQRQEEDPLSEQQEKNSINAGNNQQPEEEILRQEQNNELPVVEPVFNDIPIVESDSSSDTQSQTDDINQIQEIHEPQNQQEQQEEQNMIDDFYAPTIMSEEEINNDIDTETKDVPDKD